MEKNIAIIGAGKIGLMLAEMLAGEGYAVTLFNRPGSKREEQIIQAVESVNRKLKLENRAKLIHLTFELELVKNQQLIHYVAGAPRLDGQERISLFHDNAGVAKLYVALLAQNNPNAIIINAANPLDLITRVMHETVRKLGYKNLVIGMGSSLDTERLNDITQQVVREELGAPQAEIKGAYVLGEHGPTMVPILSNATINGIPFLEKLSHGQVAAITKRTRQRGAEIIRLTEHSDVAGPAGRLHEMTDVLLNKKGAFIPYCGCIEEGIHKDAVFMGRLGHFQDGAVAPYWLSVSDTEKTALRHSHAELQREWLEFTS